jgi:hypothetical protein
MGAVQNPRMSHYLWTKDGGQVSCIERRETVHHISVLRLATRQLCLDISFAALSASSSQGVSCGGTTSAWERDATGETDINACTVSRRIIANQKLPTHAIDAIDGHELLVYLDATWTRGSEMGFVLTSPTNCAMLGSTSMPPWCFIPGRPWHGAAAIRQGKASPPAPKHVMVQDAVKRFLASKRTENLADSTIEKLTTIFEKQFVGWSQRQLLS